MSNRAAVIGVGNTAYGSFPETDEYGLAAQAFEAAIEDCGIDKNKIDGLRASAAFPITPAWARCSASIRAGR